MKFFIAPLKYTCVMWIVLISSVESFDTKNEEELTVLANSSVYLPCNPASERQGVVAIIVLWYKADNPEPFYSYDLRQHGGGLHWSDDSVFGRRAQFESRRHPLSLTVNSVRPQDEGIYRCRVDFERGPSKTFSIQLNVVVLPSIPVVTDETGTIVEGEAGPYTEGGRVVLTCKTLGGRPPPTLVWMRDGRVVEDSFNGDARGQVRNLLHLENLSRDFLDVTFTCRASNNKITKPLDTSVKINITLAPLNVRLRRVDMNQDFVISGRVESFECISVGSHPQPQISWWKDGEEIQNPKTEEVWKSNFTRSLLNLEPSPHDLGVIITCRVENLLLPSAVLEESYKLNVYYIPLVSLKMGFGLDSRVIREGSDVFMECNVTSNPKAFSVIWLHEGKEIRHNVSKRIIVSNQTLVLQKVEKERSGGYQCQATNARGKGISGPIHLNIMYAPLCEEGLETFYQISRHVTAEISCSVDAQPKNISFRWQFNNTGNIVDLDKKFIKSAETLSVLSYTPEKKGDYGLLLCHAENIIGKQQIPCIFNVTAAKPPELLESCVIRNQSSHSVFVTCKNIPTELPTAFTMEVHTSDDLALITRVHNNTPAFIASGLTPGTAYVLHIGVKTPMGVSGPIKLRAFTVKTAEKRMGITEKEGVDSGLLPIVFGALASIIITIIILLVVIIKLCSQRGQDASRLSSKSPSLNLDDISQNLSHKETISSSFSRLSPVSDEKNPDLIPMRNDKDYQLEELRVPTSHEIIPNTQIQRKIKYSKSSSCYSVQIQAAPHNTQLNHGSYYALGSQEGKKHPKRAKKSQPIETSLSVHQREKDIENDSCNVIPAEEGSDLPTIFGGDPNFSNAPPFLPPEGFRGNIMENLESPCSCLIESQEKCVECQRCGEKSRHESTV